MHYATKAGDIREGGQLGPITVVELFVVATDKPSVSMKISPPAELRDKCVQ